MFRLGFDHPIIVRGLAAFFAAVVLLTLAVTLFV